MKGYTEGTLYDVYACTVCDASFVSPLVSDTKVYEHIYSQPESVPGYERYVRYSKLVQQVSQPLQALADAENVYWSIQQALIKHFSTQDISIVEIGSGLGYLTYSLNKAGYNARGIDISNEAVEKAIAAYGPYYEAGDILTLSDAYRKRYDCVIMTELLEHVEDPKRFMSAALAMLKDGGTLIVTTPNKTWTPSGYLWGSDVPPIHLWWFAEKSISKLAVSLGRTCEFIDFTPFTSRFHEPLWYPTIEDFQRGSPKMTQEGKYIGNAVDDDFKSKFLSIKVRYYLSYLRRRFKRKHVSSRSSTMCAVIS